jgi:hypothetical protein
MSYIKLSKKYNYHTHMRVYNIVSHLDGFGLLLGLGMGRHVKIRGEAGGLGKVENLR